MAFLMAILLITGMPVAGLALPTWPLRGDVNKQTPLESKPPSGRLQEVAPPGAVQQLREKLQRYQPNLRLVTPTDDSVINAANAARSAAAKTLSTPLPGSSSQKGKRKKAKKSTPNENSAFFKKLQDSPLQRSAKPMGR